MAGNGFGAVILPGLLKVAAFIVIAPVVGLSLAGATSLFVATRLGIPVSTTHTITGAIVGVGATRRLSAVRWGVAGRIVWAWVLTIPASAATAALTSLIISRLTP